MQTRFAKLFFSSVAVLLWLTAVAKLISASGSAKILTGLDPLFHVQNRFVMLGAGIMEIVVGTYLLFGKNYFGKVLLVLWVSTNFTAYRVGLQWLGEKSCPCLGTLGEKLPVSAATINQLLTLLITYWIVGSGYLLWKASSKSAHNAAGPTEVPAAS